MHSVRAEDPDSIPPGIQPLLVRRAAVLGAGLMGSRIAAHLANAGIPVLLLDLAAGPGKPLPAQSAIGLLAQAKPAPLFDPDLAKLITAGSFDADIEKLAGCDWVIEAVVEQLEVKTALLERVLPHLKPSAVLTTNTSGLPIVRIGAGLGPWRRRFFGTHFFNPPRYLRLLEVVATSDTDPALVAAFAAFADLRLGKQVVMAHDTPNFIANRIGMEAFFTAVQLMRAQGLSPEEVDALTGPAIGWPRTGTFRLADLVGVDVLSHVAANFPAGQSDGLVGIFDEMVRRGWLGDKAGQGFYRKIRLADGSEERQTLDLERMEYRPWSKPAIPELDLAKNAATAAERLRALLTADPARDISRDIFNDKAVRFLWPFLAAVWNCAAERIDEAADDAPSIDRALCAGFNWELGPFEMWDAVGVEASLKRLDQLGLPVSERARALLVAGQPSWYAGEGRACFHPATGHLELIAKTPGHSRAADYRRTHGVVRTNAGASLVDLGDGIGCIELHSMKNAIGGDVLSMVLAVLGPDAEPVRQFRGFVLSGDRGNFSVGANLLQLLLIAQEGDWDELAAVIRGFQQMTSAIKFCPRPVVAAPFGLTLGGGAEICLHAARRQPHAETYIGLVEAGVGLIPAGGGSKEMLLRALDAASALVPRDPAATFVRSVEVQTALRRAFETIVLAKVSTSGVDGQRLGLLSASDRFTMNRERLLEDAKAQAQALAQSGYAPPQPRTDIPAPGTSALATLEMAIHLMAEAGMASEHDCLVARRAAEVLVGGRLTAGALISEQTLLDLELEAFLSLCGQRKTQERIAFTLKTGKPLRN
jgi:3-hydroxyacyl-CoA dehydrogenase